MESDSQPGSTPNPSTHRLAELIGTLIAVLTLLLPAFVVTRYSSSPTPTTYSLIKSR